MAERQREGETKRNRERFWRGLHPEYKFERERQRVRGTDRKRGGENREREMGVREILMEFRGLDKEN